MEARTEVRKSIRPLPSKPSPVPLLHNTIIRSTDIETLLQGDLEERQRRDDPRSDLQGQFTRAISGGDPRKSL